MGSIRLLLHKRSRTDIVFTAKMWHEMLWCLLGRARVSRPPTQLSDGLRRCLMHWTRALRRQLLTFRLMVYIPLGTVNDKNLENCWPTCSLERYENAIKVGSFKTYRIVCPLQNFNIRSSVSKSRCKYTRVVDGCASKRGNDIEIKNQLKRRWKSKTSSCSWGSGAHDAWLIYFPIAHIMPCHRLYVSEWTNLFCGY